MSSIEQKKISSLIPSLSYDELKEIKIEIQQEQEQRIKVTKEIKKLFEWTPEGFLLERVSKIVNVKGMYVKGDDETPFFSEAYLYNLLGKEDARTLLCLIEQAFASVGIKIPD